MVLLADGTGLHRYRIRELSHQECAVVLLSAKGQGILWRKTVNVPEEDHRILDNFIDESLELLERATPFVRALIAQPDREDILSKMTESCFHLFHSIKGTGAFLHLDHLVGPAEAMEYLLDRVRSGVQLLTPRHLSLLAESCRFMEEGLPLVLAEKSDERLASSAGTLTTAIFQSIQGIEEILGSEGVDASFPQEMRDAFLGETGNLLATAEQEFVLWDFIAIDRPRVAELCRLLSRMKQNFALFELKDMERLCLALESTLTRYLQGEFFQTEYPERVFLRCIDAMRSALTRFTCLEDAAVTGLEHHLAALQGLIRQPIGKLLVEAGLVDPLILENALEVQRTSQEKPRRLGEVLVDMGEVTPDQVQHILQTQHAQRTRGEQAENLQGSVCPATLITTPRQEVCVDGRILARMIALINQLATEYESDEGSAPLLAELQALAQSCDREARSAFSVQLKRVVHDWAVQGNKRVYFVIEGMEDLLDQRDISLLAEPLLQLLRNGVEHGLETVEERVRAGKRKSGRLTLLVLQQGNELWVSVEDDGRGIDMRKISTLVVEHRLVTAEEVGRLSGRELTQLLFQPRAVTAKDAQGAAGRNAGLPAVRDSLQRIQGKIEILSRLNKGTRVTLRVPRQH
jgi:two-component system chemotaxis sensor kinase CheA